MNALSIPVAEAEGRLSSLLAEVAKGAEVTLTEGGRAVARIVPAALEPKRSPQEIEAAMARVRELRKGITLSLEEIRASIEEGRM